MKKMKKMMMKLKQMKGKITFINVYSYLLGNFRYHCLHSKFRWLIRKHIREQYEYRVRTMDRECYDKGYCKVCGCSTTALQCANKSCDNFCYPVMLSKSDWNYLKRDRRSKIRIGDYLWSINKNDRKFKRFNPIKLRS